MNTNLNLVLDELRPKRVLAGLVFVLFLAYALQPFPEFEMSFVPRLGFWLGAVVAAFAATRLSRHFQLPKAVVTRPTGHGIALILLILALFVPILWSVAWILFTVEGHHAPGILSVLPYGVLFAAGMVFVQDRTSSALPQVDLQVPTPRIAKRLPASFRGQIFRLSVRDHSVDIVTSEGTFTIRFRFTDAIEEMEPVPGHCTHRSHWVADAAVDRVEKQDGKTFLRLKNGDLVPVSRTYKPMLERDDVI